MICDVRHMQQNQPGIATTLDWRMSPHILSAVSDYSFNPVACAMSHLCVAERLLVAP
jgi:hypothetical protein